MCHVVCLCNVSWYHLLRNSEWITILRSHTLPVQNLFRVVKHEKQNENKPANQNCSLDFSDKGSIRYTIISTQAIELVLRYFQSLRSSPF